jgi:DNA-binding NarL/FixJ family response regulator
MSSRNLMLDVIKHEKDRYIIPHYQRNEVWQVARKRKLIDSILRGWPLPKFYVALDSSGLPIFEVIDGQQRLSTVLEFLNDEFSLSSDTVRKFQLQGARFNFLSADQKQKLLQFVLQCDELMNASEEERREYFLRLQMGKPLTGREKLKATISGLTDFSMLLARHPFFKKHVGLADTQDAYFDITSKVVAIALRGLGTNLRLNGIQDLFDNQKSFTADCSVARHLQKTFDFLAKAFPAKTTLLVKSSFTQSVITLASQLVASGQAEGHEAEFLRFVQLFDANLKKYGKSSSSVEADDYIEFQLAIKNNLLDDTKTRHSVLVRKMHELAPNLAAILAVDEGLKSWVPNEDGYVSGAEDAEIDQPSRMRITSHSVAVRDILNHYQIPTFQRGEVWETARKRLLIDSILRGWKLPKFYLSSLSDEANEFDVIDGQQRLAAIRDFVNGKFNILPATAKYFGLPSGKFGDLPKDIANRILGFTIEYDLILGATQEERVEFFRRLQEGMPLNGKERLNAVHSNLRDFCADLTRRDPKSLEDNRHPFFQTSLALPDNRHTFFDIASKAAALTIQGFDARLSLEDLMQLFEAQKKFSSDSPNAVHMLETFDFLARAFPQRNAALSSQIFVQSVIVLASRLVATGKSAGQEDIFRRFVEQFQSHIPKGRRETLLMTDLAYKEFSGATQINIKNVGRVLFRHNLLLEKMHITHPTLAAVFQEKMVDTKAYVAADLDTVSSHLIQGALPYFSRGEHAVITYMMLGLTYREIAERLQTSPGAVSVRLNGIYRKLHVNTRPAAIDRIEQAQKISSSSSPSTRPTQDRSDDKRGEIIRITPWTSSSANQLRQTASEVSRPAEGTTSLPIIFPQYLASNDANNLWLRLTHSEKSVLALIAEELSNKNMADRLGVSLGAVCGCAERVSNKLGIDGRANLRAWYRRNVLNIDEPIIEAARETQAPIAQMPIFQTANTIRRQFVNSQKELNGERKPKVAATPIRTPRVANPKPKAPAIQRRVHQLSARTITARETQSFDQEEFAQLYLKPLLAAYAALTPPVTTYGELYDRLRSLGEIAATKDTRALLSGKADILIQNHLNKQWKINPKILPLVRVSGQPTTVVLADLIGDKKVQINVAQGTNGHAVNGSAADITWDHFVSVFPTLAQTLNHIRGVNSYEDLELLVRPNWTNTQLFRSLICEAVSSSQPYDPSTGRLKRAIATIIISTKQSLESDSQFPEPEYVAARQEFRENVNNRHKRFVEIARDHYLALCKTDTSKNTSDAPILISTDPTTGRHNVSVPEEYNRFLHRKMPPMSTVRKNPIVKSYESLLTGNNEIMRDGALTPQAKDFLALIKATDAEITSITGAPVTKKSPGVASPTVVIQENIAALG